FWIGRDLGPHANISGPFPRAFLPSLVAELARIWNRIEPPYLLAGSHIECAHQTFCVRAEVVTETFRHRRSDNDHVIDYRGRRMQTDLTFFQIDLFILADDNSLLQINHAVLAKRRN